MFVPAFGKLSWLWFLIALFINSLCNYPLLGWIRRRTQHKPLTLWDDGVYVICLLIVMTGWALMNIYIPEDNFKSPTTGDNIGKGSNLQ